VFPIINIGDTSVWLDNTSYPPTAILSFPSTNYPRTTKMTSDSVVFILIRMRNDKQTMMEHYILCQPYLHCQHGLKYNPLLYNDIVIINEAHCHRIEDHQLQPYVHDSNPDNLAPQAHVPPVLTATEPCPYYLTQELVDHRLSPPPAHPQMLHHIRA
jgi:hypothetical protein